MSEELVQRLFWHVEKVLGPVSDEPIVNAHDSDRVVLLFNFRAEAKRAVEYWYRQGKDDQYHIDAPIIEKQAAEIQRLVVVNQALRKQRNKANNAIRDLDFANCAETIDTVAAQDIEIERLRIECEYIASVTAEPLVNSLETGFRHSPLTPKEREIRYMEACALAYQSARAALGEQQ